MQRNTHILTRRIVALVSALLLCFALTVPALADEVLSGTASARASRYYSSSAINVPAGWSEFPTSFDMTVSLSSGGSSVSASTDLTSSKFTQYAFSRLVLPDSFFPSGSQSGVYLSFYYRTAVTASQNHAPSASDFSVQYLDIDSGSYVIKPVTSVSLFAPSSSANSLSDGVTIVARLNNSLSSPLSSVTLWNGSSDAGPSFSMVLSQFSDPLKYITYTSFRVVSTSSSAELDALEDMASAISSQNEILSQFYGDIVAICNQIYQRLGDLQAAQEEANALFSNVIALLKTTNGKLDAINMAMSTYFELLINQLKQEGIDTRTAIADAEARLEAYLKPMIDYFNELEEQTGESASTLPGHKTDIDGFDNQGYGINSDGQAGVAALVPVLTSFSFIFQIIAIFIGVGVINLLVKKGLS